MRLRVYRTLWGVLEEGDGAKAGSPVLGTEEALHEIARCLPLLLFIVSLLLPFLLPFLFAPLHHSCEHH